MRKVNVTELRNHLPQYLSNIQSGDEILVTLHGKVIARIVAPLDTQNDALQQLKALRKRCKIGDVVSPTGSKWEADK